MVDDPQTESEIRNSEFNVKEVNMQNAMSSDKAEDEIMTENGDLDDEKEMCLSFREGQGRHHFRRKLIQRKVNRKLKKLSPFQKRWKKISQVLPNHFPSSKEVKKLSCIGQDIEAIPKHLIDGYSKVTKRLDLSFNKIKNVQGLEEFVNLEELVLDNNDIDSLTSFPHLAYLHTLTLNKNKLPSIDELLDDIEKKFPQLTYLSLLGNTACPNQLSSNDKDEEDYIRYRHYVLYRLPRLKFLDSSQVKSSDHEEAKRIGPFMRLVRGSENMLTEEPETPPSPTNYSPLPDSNRTEEHLSSYGKRYAYHGKHSEGNRFIRNTEL